MSIWFAKGIILAATVVMVAIRAPHGQRSRTVPVVVNRQGRLEVILLTCMWVSFLVPIVWIATPALRFADYPLHPVAFASGALCFGLSLWMFFRSHADLGRNWSISLEVREKHEVVTVGVYRSIRHPMYSSLLLYAVGQALALPNWIAGPAYLLAMLVLIAARIGPEERMMLDKFGDEYRAYMGRTRRLIPGVW